MRTKLSNGCIAIGVLFLTACGGGQPEAVTADNGATADANVGVVEEMGPMGGGGGNMMAEPANGTDGTGAGATISGNGGNISTGTNSGGGGTTGGTTPGG